MVGLVSIQGHLIVSSYLCDTWLLKLLGLTDSVRRLLLDVRVAAALPVSRKTAAACGLALAICIRILAALLT